MRRVGYPNPVNGAENDRLPGTNNRQTTATQADLIVPFHWVVG